MPPGSKSRKRSAESVCNPLTLRGIKAQLPIFYDPPADSYDPVQTARALFGKAAKPLTLSLARKLAGKKVYSMYDFLHHIDDDKVASKEKRLQILAPFHILSAPYTEGGEMVLPLKEGTEEFDAYLFDGAFCLGSGASIIFVFV